MTSTMLSPGTSAPTRCMMSDACSGQRVFASASISRKLGLGHAGIMLERHLLDRAHLVAHGADEADDGADVGAAALRRAISAPMSKSSCWTRITSASGHRREEGDLARGPDPRIVAHMALVDGGADHLVARERIGEFGSARLEPGDQLGDGRDRQRGSAMSSAALPTFSLTQAK